MNKNLESPFDRVDDALSSSPQQAVRSVVRQLPDETPSMAWRSSLNERLMVEAARRKRRARIAWFLRPALGLGLACTLAAVLLIRTDVVRPDLARPDAVRTAPVASESGLEAALVSVHRQSAYAWDVAGVGLSPVDWQPAADSVAAPRSPSSSSASGSGSSWSDEDLDTL